MHQGLILKDILQDIFGAHLYFRNVEKTCCCSCTQSGLFGVLLEKVLVFIDILAGGKEPGVVSAAPERRNLEIVVDVGWRSWHFLGVVIQPCSVYSRGSPALGCLWVVNTGKLPSQSKIKLQTCAAFGFDVINLCLKVVKVSLHNLLAVSFRKRAAVLCLWESSKSLTEDCSEQRSVLNHRC